VSTLTPDWLCFDLDGTLVDSVPDITFSLNQMLASMQLSTVNEQLARTWIGNGAIKLIERALTHALQCSPGKSDLDRAKQYFFMAYEKNIAVKTIVFPGCIELLEYLQSKHIPMACVTNKPRKFTPPLLDKLSMSHYFSALVCGDDLPTQKPNPAMLIHAIDQLGGMPEKGFMIGDSQTDMQTAKAAGAGAIYVSYGYNRGVCVEKYRPIRVNSLDELQQML
jgi:phosphoglycolate phosphatase